jgi:hypothetical protein
MPYAMNQSKVWVIVKVLKTDCDLDLRKGK